MLRKIDKDSMGKGNIGWLKSVFHFSFADYYNPSNINFGVLRVINDDLIKAGTGFDDHPHNDMEIISYVVNGDLKHGDSMGNKKVVSRGHVQYMSAGTGVVHNEYNGGSEELRILQMWIYPDKKNYTPNYGDYKYNWEDRINKWLHLVGNKNNIAKINIHQDANIYSTYLEKGNEISFKVDKNRQAYLVQIEGDSIINNIDLNQRDGLEIIEEDLDIKAKTDSHILLIEMKR